MNQNNPYNTTNQKSTQSRYKAPANFIEALKEAGGSIAKNTAKGISQDLIQGVAKQTVDTVFNSGSQSANQDQQPQSNLFDFESFINSSEQKNKQALGHQEVKHNYESPAVEIYNQRQMEVNKKIDAIRQELAKLAREVVSLDQSTQAAISQEVVAPGTYHLNFFEKLLTYIKLLRKKVVESRHWANLHQQRSQHKSYYWQQAGKKAGGTKFSLSNERTVATQTG